MTPEGEEKFTLFGKCTIITYMYCKYFWKHQNEHYIKSINKLIYSVIWKILKEMKGIASIGHVIDTGLGKTDVESKIIALKVSGSLD